MTMGTYPTEVISKLKFFIFTKLHVHVFSL